MVWYTAVVKYGIKKKLIYNADPAAAGWLGGLALSKANKNKFRYVPYTSFRSCTSVAELELESHGN